MWPGAARATRPGSTVAPSATRSTVAQPSSFSTYSSGTGVEPQGSFTAQSSSVAPITIRAWANSVQFTEWS